MAIKNKDLLGFSAFYSFTKSIGGVDKRCAFFGLKKFQFVGIVVDRNVPAFVQLR